MCPRTTWIPAAIAAAALMACGSGDDRADASPTPPDGESVYAQPVADGNTFSCSTCHALREPAADGFRRPGHPIGDATRRPTYKNGALTSMLDAVNTCLVEWMVASPWTEQDERWIALHAFLDSQAEVDVADPIAISIVDPPADTSGGDAAVGETFFNGACAICHGQNASGTERGPPLLGSLLEADQIANRVRTSGPTDQAIYPGLTGGRMPFWGADRISDDELRDAIAFVLSNEPELPPDAGPGGPDAGDGECGSTHARVGQTATLTTRFHNVSGTARIADDCTIVFENFSYDGAGIDVRIYGALDNNFSSGFAMTGDLLRAGGYSNDTLIARIPDGFTLDDLDSVSVWCVAVDQSFGDAQFPGL